MLDLHQDYFGLFGLSPVFRIDEERLEQAYLDLQGRVHPDRFVHLSDAEKRLSMQWATHVNGGFRTLRNPLSRGCYLLELQGVDAGFDTNTAMAPEFLMEQMEWREALGEACEAADPVVLEEMARRLRKTFRERVDELAGQFDDSKDLSAAADTLRRLKFLDKLQEEINDALTALDS